MAQIWTKDRVTDEHAETAKKGVRHASPGSMDDFDSIPSTFYYDALMLSLNEQTMSSGVDENCSRAPSPEAKKKCQKLKKMMMQMQLLVDLIVIMV